MNVTVTSQTTPRPFLVDGSRQSRVTPRESLPTLWIGYLLSITSFVSFVVGSFSESPKAFAIVSLCGLAGLLYWLYWLYRLHKVLAEGTFGKYPISGRRAVGFQLVPFYSLIWIFKWPKQIGAFLKENGAGDSFRYRWIGFALLLVSVFGNSVLGLQPAVLFFVAAYVNRRVARVLPWAVPVPHSRRQQVKLALLAGVGASLGWILSEALHTLASDPHGAIIDLFVIAVVSGLIVTIVDPLADKFRIALGVPHEHANTVAELPLKVRALLVGIFAFTSVCHGLLHKQLDEQLRNAPYDSGMTWIGALLVASGITYCWVSRPRRRNLQEAGRVGVISGTAIGIALVLGTWLWSLAMPPRNSTEHVATYSVPTAEDVTPGAAVPNTAVEDEKAPLTRKTITTPLPVVVTIALSLLRSAHLLKPFWLATLTLPPALFGLLGAISMHRVTKASVLGSLSTSLIITALACGVVQGLLARHWTSEFAYRYVLLAMGWCVGLWVCPYSESLLSSKPTVSNVSEIHHKAA